MVKLKTLRDLEKEFEGCEITDGISEHSLRRAAIEWIKQMEDECVEFDYNLVPEGCDQWSQEIAINWIKHFFNISEDDLK